MVGSHGTPSVVKVESYGIRERQELRANVFARELLLPRCLISNGALKGTTPRSMAAALGIPLEFARQQTLDALLLPVLVPKPETVQPASDDQRLAAHAAERFAHVVAGPGTGKTMTLVHRVKHLIDDKCVDPSRLLVLTFTNKAAAELVERLRSAGLAKAADVWAGTFHAFGLEFIRKYYDHFSLEANLNVADKMNSVALLIAQLPKLDLRFHSRLRDPYDWLGKVLRGITRLKEELVSPLAYRNFVATQLHSDGEIQREREDLATLYAAYEQALADEKMADFVDLVARPALALAKDRVPFSEFVDRFDHVLVDEYQDVTEAMVQLVRQLAHKKSLWVVGDIRQAIHHWRGASLKSLLRFDSVFKAAAENRSIGKYPLKWNRRSREEILAVVEEVGRRHQLQADLPLSPMEATRGAGGHKPCLVTCKERVDVPLAVLRGVEVAKKAGVDYGDQIVLSRASKDIKDTAEVLSKADIPIVYVGELADRREVKAYLCLIQLLVERQPRALAGLIGYPDIAMPMADIQWLMERAATQFEFQRGRWLHTSGLTLSSAGEVVRQRLAALLGTATHKTNAWTFVCDLLLEKSFALPAENDDEISTWMTRIALWQFAYSVRNGDGDMREAQLARYLMRQRLRQRVGDTYVDRTLPPEAAALNGVRLDTVHGSKGLEFGAVHLGWVTAESYDEAEPWRGPDHVLDIVPPEALRSSMSEFLREEAVERNNLLYVAVSRAKEQLYLYEHQDYAKPPRQLRYCEGLLVHASFKPDKTIGTPAEVTATFAPMATIDFSQYRTYATCPLQYWYSTILKLGQEQRLDAGVRARTVVMESLKAVASLGADPVSALAGQWALRGLPTAADDPSLWRDAQSAFARGMARIVSMLDTGHSFQELSAVVGGLRVQLPWGFVQAKAHLTTCRLIRFEPSSDVLTLLKPFAQSLEVPGTTVLEAHYVVSDRVDPVKVKSPESTKGYGAAVKFLKGSNAPQFGRHCGRCAYTSICPSIPTL